MNAAKIIEETQRHGLQVWRDGERLKVRPSSALSPQLRTILLQHKPALLAYLKEQGLTVAPEAPQSSSERGAVSTPGRDLPDLQIQELLSFVGVAKAGGWDLEATIRYTLPLLPGLTEEQIREAWLGGSIERHPQEEGQPYDCDNTPSPPLAPPHPSEGKLAYLKEHASEEELALIEPPASLSIAELYERVRERALFFERWPQYLEAIRWRLEEGWSQERVLAYLAEYLPSLTLAHIQHAARQKPATNLPRDKGRSSPTAPDLPTEEPVAWIPEAARLIEWFRVAFEAGELPGESFDLAPWIRVEEPSGFYQKLLFDIEEGPAGPRARYGAVQEELHLLYDWVNSSTAPPCPAPRLSPPPSPPPVERPTGNLSSPRSSSRRVKFNRTNNNIGWACWSWNPVVGCKNDCPYCYARPIVERNARGSFTSPRFYKERLAAPTNTKIPAKSKEIPGIDRVFLGSMTDLWGSWIPRGWIEEVLEAMATSPQWQYLTLTKNPERYLEFCDNLPANLWLGSTADIKPRAEQTEEVFLELRKRGVPNPLFASCEPLLEPLGFKETVLECMDWVIIGALSLPGKTTKQPDPAWVEGIVEPARQAGCQIYFKSNLTARPTE